MALLKNKAVEFGVTITYWAVDQVNINWFTKSAHIELMGYRSEDLKKKEKERPVETVSYDFSEDNFPFTKGGNNEAEFYDWLAKQENYFTDAVAKV